MKHMRNKITTLLALSLVGLSATANAELIIEDGNNRAVISGSSTVSSTTPTITNIQSPSPLLKMKPAPYQSKNVTEKGIRIITAPVEGWGDNIELSIVLKQIVPDGWKAETKNYIDMNQKISWKAENEAWIDVFGRIADQNNFKANVDWNTKRIDLIGNGAVTKTSTVTKTTNSDKKALKPVSENATLKLKPVSEPRPIAATPVEAQKVWKLSADKTLRQNIEEWAKKEGWVVSWDAPDYRIVSGFELKGDLTSPKGPIARVVKSYESAEQPLVAKIFKENKVIRIESRYYNQETVVTRSIGDDYKSMK